MNPAFVPFAAPVAVAAVLTAVVEVTAPARFAAATVSGDSPVVSAFFHYRL